ncbi:MAG: M23 family metallopeptidase [Geobacteraceae bacterium]|nr:M23 family metallopeptidase [Geobacteraceae bacterium]
MKQLILTIIMLVSIFCSERVNADIYRLEGEDDVVTFSDSPGDRRYKLVMKEQQLRSTKTAKESSSSAKEERVKGTSGFEGSSSGRSLPVDGVITSTTGMRSDPFNGKLTHHNGLDIAAPSGTPVKPVAPGTVIFSGWKGGYGNTVILDHGDGMVTVYAHHSSNSAREGDHVEMNSVIALTGSTGRSTGPHLHFEAWQNGANVTQSFLPGSSPARTAAKLVDAPIRRHLQSDGTLLFTNLR